MFRLDRVPALALLKAAQRYKTTHWTTQNLQQLEASLSSDFLSLPLFWIISSQVCSPIQHRTRSSWLTVALILQHSSCPKQRLPRFLRVRRVVLAPYAVHAMLSDPFIQTKTPGAAKKTPVAKATPAATTAKATPDPAKADPAKADPAKVKSTKSSKAPKK